MIYLFALLLFLSAPRLTSAFTAMLTGAEVTVTLFEPAANADGSVLTDLAKIRIYHDTSGSMQMEKEIAASGPSGGATGSVAVSVPVIEGQEKIITFQATAVDTSGNESKPSEKVSVRVDRLAPAPPR